MNRMHITAWYRGLLITWLAFGLPVLVLAFGFAGGNPFQDLNFNRYSIIDNAIWLAGWLLVLAPLWLAPFGVRRGGSNASPPGARR